ncbi:MAG: hypothetical protein JW801_14110 [Bacteroidales bacterium]|nr:hypothetical protein [Bacteroidales bacterium]
MKRNYFYLLLALLFFFCFGEEISWGQRIFHVKTPDYISEVNAQQEINIHNLNVFHGRDEANQRKSGIEVWYSLARIFSLFWFTYCFLIPLIYRYIRKASVFLNWLALPIPSIWLGILMIVNYGFPKAIENNHSYWINRAATEIKEANLALLFLAVIWILYWNDRHKLRQNSVST